MKAQVAQKLPGIVQLKNFLHITKEVNFKPDEYVFEEGETNENFYLVMEGEIEISKKTSAGKAKVIAHLCTGEVLGEGVLSDVTLKPASARAITETKLLFFHKDDFEKILKQDPKAASEFLLSILNVLNERLNQTNSKFIALYEINKLLGIYRDDLSKLSQGLIQKLIAITESEDGVICLKNPFAETYRVLYSTADDVSDETFKDYKKDRSQIIDEGGFQYLFVNLKDVGYLALRRKKSAIPFEDDHLRLLILVAEQAGNTIESASRRASEKARNVLHQKKIIL